MSFINVTLLLQLPRSRNTLRAAHSIISVAGRVELFFFSRVWLATAAAVIRGNQDGMAVTGIIPVITSVPVPLQ